jgi:hypothetical protein
MVATFQGKSSKTRKSRRSEEERGHSTFLGYARRHVQLSNEGGMFGDHRRSQVMSLRLKSRFLVYQFSIRLRGYRSTISRRTGQGLPSPRPARALSGLRR